MKKMKRCVALLVMILPLTGIGQIPAGYYNDAIGKSGYELQSALSHIIGNHNVVGYDELWYYYQFTDLKSDSTIWDIYTDPYCSFSVTDHGATGNSECVTYNREHAFCQSWFGATAEPPFSDLHHIFPVSSWINSYRNNWPYGEVANPERQFNNGSKWGKNTFVSTVDAAPTSTAFEPIDEFKGDIARALFYVSTRYMFEDSNFCTDAKVAPMTYRSRLRPWAIEMLKNWVIIDPVSQKEIDRNNAIYQIQHNRNPYIDHPQLVNLVFGNDSANYTFDPGFVPVSRLHISGMSIPNTTTITLAFDTLLVPSSVEHLSNYTISNGVGVDSVELSDGNTVVLHLQKMLTPGYPYYMIVRNVQSVSGFFLPDTSLSFVYGYSSNHQPIISWTFDSTQSAPNTSKLIDADINLTGFAARLFLDGTHGASDFNQKASYNELTTYPGTRIGDPRISAAYDGSALVITGSYANGKSMVWSFSSKFWDNLMLTFANRRTPTGFFCHRWEYSFNGVDFDTLSDVVSVADSLNQFELKTIDLQQLEDFNRRDSVFLRLTLDSAYSVSGNNRFDNFTVFAQKCSDTYEFSDTIEKGEPYEKYGFNIQGIDGVGTLKFSREVVLDDACDSSIVLTLNIVGTETVTASIGNDGFVTDNASLDKVVLYPNPVAESTKVKLLNENHLCGNVFVSVFDMTGKAVSTMSLPLNSFTHEVQFDASGLKSGIYLVKVFAEKFAAYTKMVKL